MPVQDSDRKLVQAVFDAMHAGPAGEQQMVGLFAEDGAVVEPFSGQPREHKGQSAIRNWFREAVASMPPEMAIRLDRLDVSGAQVRADWTCTSPVFASPMKGYDLYDIRGGKIARLEIVVTDMPPMG